jgi:4-amino-4-deoxy-L-arabinose transferase-like glycosyltransferase
VLDDRQLRRLAPAILAALAILLFLPFLSSFGFWDPYEIRMADAARAVNAAPFTWGPQLGRPPLNVWLVALGFKAFGVGELGGRLPMAVASIALVLATYWAGARLVGRRAALFGAFALATTPEVLLGARSLVSDAPMMLASVLAIGGLARAAWPERDDSTGMRIVALVAGLAGLAIGQFAAGAIVGVLMPLAAVTIAMLFAGGVAGVTVAFGLATLAAAVRVILEVRKPGWSATLGGMAHAPTHVVTWVQHVKHAGFALFPWIAIAPVAIVSFFVEQGKPDEGAAAEAAAPAAAPKRDPLGTMVVLSWFVCAWAAGTMQSAVVQDIHVPVGPPLLLLVGAFGDELFDDARPLPFAGLLIALAAIMLGHDFFLAPEQYVGVHMSETVRWPGPLTHVPYVVMAFAAFFAGVLGLGIGAPLSRPGGEKSQQGRRLLFGAAAGAALAMALATQLWIVPQVSKHLSAREIYGKAKTLDPNAPLGQYRFNAAGSQYYMNGKTPQTLATLADMFQFLAKPERVFVMAGVDELPAIDQQSRTIKQQYFVIDNSNSRYLTISNRLGPNEKDLNPLKLFVSELPPTPAHKLDVNFEDKIQLIGYDLPDEVSRGQDFKVRLYFKVLQPIGGAYKIFVHFDGPGTRFQGDHAPLDGRFPTSNWVTNYYITDEYNVVPDRARQVSGYYRVFIGFWLGDSRLKVTAGPQDGENRVRLANMNVK